MVKREGSNDWAVWCNHVLFELERLDQETALAKKKAFNAWILGVVLQAQLLIGGVGLGYMIRVVLDHLGGKP